MRRSPCQEANSPWATMRIMNTNQPAVEKNSDANIQINSFLQNPYQGFKDVIHVNPCDPANSTIISSENNHRHIRLNTDEEVLATVGSLMNLAS